MMKRMKFEVGERYGRLVIKARIPNKDRRFICTCDCGGEREVCGSNLRQRRILCCGCVRPRGPARKHGYYSGGSGADPHFNSWKSMIHRCINPKNKQYKDYGGRGITVCDRWRTYENFLADVGPRPPGKSIDRIDNDAGYSPGNVRWATKTMQANNQRKPRILPSLPKTDVALMYSSVLSFGV